MIFKKKKTKEQLASATQWQLIWLKFKAHKPAVISLYVIILMYIVAMFAGFFAVNDPVERRVKYKFLPPTKIHFTDGEGSFSPRVYPKRSKLNTETLRREYTDDPDRPAKIRLFARGAEYKICGLVTWDRHLLGTDSDDPFFFPFGTDGSGRCLYSRLIFGGQLSLSIGLLAVAMTFVLGILVGGITGYFGGILDNVTQRITEVLMCFPTLPLWMALSAALPLDWSIIKVYFAISVILSIMGWTGLARTVRSKFLALREEEFVVAAMLDGAGASRLAFRHMLPSFASHLIVSASLAIPSMIMGETALSFLGIGLRAPAISWGVLLQDAQNVEAVALRPWLLIPAIAVILIVVAFNFVGDGLRDAADPYR
jgi:peptide/nickel transport system permease protein